MFDYKHFFFLIIIFFFTVLIGELSQNVSFKYCYPLSFSFVIFEVLKVLKQFEIAVLFLFGLSAKTFHEALDVLHRKYLALWC